jgi:predicted GH43/DUF377 family glycosyl hydrolase
MCKISKYILYMIILIILFVSSYYTCNPSIVNNYYINSLIYFQPNNSYKLDFGPYMLKTSNPLKTIKLYDYNPSICQSNNGDIIVVSRISGHTFENRKNTCMKLLKSYTYDKDINDAFSTFPENKLESSSVSIVRNLTKNETKIVPFNFDNKKLKGQYLGCEDPRIFTFNNKIWIYFHYIGRDNVYNKDRVSKYITIAPLDNLSNFFHLYTTDMRQTEKNWMPFEYNNELYFEYSIQPRVILKAFLDKNSLPTGYCEKIYKPQNTKHNLNNRRFGGGAPSVRIKINGKYYFLGIAHTNGLVKTITVRKNFFYIFRAEPPFDILWFGQEFNMLKQYSSCIDFVTGLMVKNDKNTDDITDYKVFVSFGVEDCYGCINEYNLGDVVRFDF